MKAKGADVKLNVFKGHIHSIGVYNFVQQAFTTFAMQSDHLAPLV